MLLSGTIEDDHDKVSYTFGNVLVTMDLTHESYHAESENEDDLSDIKIGKCLQCNT
jgi:hypothetical protein